MGIEKARRILGRLAADAAADGTVTWLTSHGNRIAAIVPPSAAHKIPGEAPGMPPQEKEIDR